MALVKLSDSWVINDYEQILQSSITGQAKNSPTLSGLTHHAWPGLTWSIKLYPRGNSKAKPNYASAYVKAIFGSAKDSVTSVWAEWTMTIVTGDASKANLQGTFTCAEYLLGGPEDWGFQDAFQQTLPAALSKGKLELKLDLTLFKIVDLLKCREPVRALLSDKRYGDIVGKIEGKTFIAHKAIMAKRGTGIPDSVPLGTTAKQAEAFLAAIYFDKFDFQSDWQLALGVYKLAERFAAVFLKEFCDNAMADLVPSLGFSALLQLLPEAVRCNAAVTTADCFRRLRETQGLLASPEFMQFVESIPEDIMGPMVLATLLSAQCRECEPSSTVFHAAEIKLSHTWPISKSALYNAVTPQATFVQSPLFLEHRAFPFLKWQLEFHPCGNAKDPEHKHGYASLYLKAIFGPNDKDLKAVYASWKATIITKDGLPVTGSPDFILYTGAKEMQFGYANAFQFDPHASEPEATDSDLEIRLELTIVSIPEMLKCRDLISSLRSNTEYSDVEIVVNGTTIKAHKFLLAARSTEFARIFKAEKVRSGSVQVNDATPEAFKSLIAGIYYESWDFLADMEATIGVLKLAERFGVADLKRYCDDALAHFVSKDNVFEILPHAAGHNAAATKSAGVKILCASEELLASEGWANLKEHYKNIALDVVEATEDYFGTQAVKRITT